MRFYVSGGTGGRVRTRAHSAVAWLECIVDTARVLEEFGVSSGRRLLIGQPSFPWAIGEVFAEAATLVGAEPICFGTLAFHCDIIPRWRELAPTAMLASPSEVRWLAREGLIGDGSIIICAGEPFTRDAVDAILGRVPDAALCEVYGCSELGTLGYRRLHDPPGFQMNPRFGYDLDSKKSGELIVIQCGIEVRTGDRCTSCTPTPVNLWSHGPRFEVVGRISDQELWVGGFRLDASIAERIQHGIGSECVQLECDSFNHRVTIRCVSDKPLRSERIVREFLSHCPEWAASEIEGLQVKPPDVAVSIVQPEQLKKSKRGKVIQIYEVSDEPD